jgi:hypothetical protein
VSRNSYYGMRVNFSSSFSLVMLIFVLLLQTFKQLGNLCNLNTLRLECGGSNPDAGLGEALKNLTKLVQIDWNNRINHSVPSADQQGSTFKYIELC